MQSVEPIAPARRSWARRHPVAVGLSLAVHLSLAAALLFMVAPKSTPVEPTPVTVALIPGPPLSPAPAAPAGAKAVIQTPQAPESVARRTTIPPPPQIKPLGVGKSDAIAPSAELSAAELAGAASADGAGSGGGGNGSGAGGGACNMARRVQEALRKDQLVLTAARAPSAAGKALRVWNGDWVQSTGEDGKGLAAVREAIIWEVAFAPAACRAEPVHGLVLLSLNDSPGATRLAVGGGDWRWSDLLGMRR